MVAAGVRTVTRGQKNLGLRYEATSFVSAAKSGSTVIGIARAASFTACSAAVRPFSIFCSGRTTVQNAVAAQTTSTPRDGSMSAIQNGRCCVRVMASASSPNLIVPVYTPGMMPSLA